MNSHQLYRRSRQIIPGGVHSPVRAFGGLERSPLFIERAEGAKFWDVDGGCYIDFCMSFGPLILGHCPPSVHEKMLKALERGWSYGACEPYSLELAELIISRLPAFAEQIRFVNSGTEAVMTAIRLARGVSGRNKIVKFNGCYHGHVDSMLIKAGSGVTEVPQASSLGVPPGVSQDTICLELGDQKGVEATFERYGNEIAAVVIEPLPANNGLVVQDRSFLSFLREITKANEALLIFDEVISGFRVSFGGMAEKTEVFPDIATYGKIIGGEFPWGPWLPVGTSWSISHPREVFIKRER